MKQLAFIFVLLVATQAKAQVNPFGGFTMKYIPSKNNKVSETAPEPFSLKELINVFDNPKNIEVLMSPKKWMEDRVMKINDSLTSYNFIHISLKMSIQLQANGKNEILLFGQTTSMDQDKIVKDLINNDWNVLEVLEYPGYTKQTYFYKEDLCISVINYGYQINQYITTKEKALQEIANIKRYYEK